LKPLAFLLLMLLVFVGVVAYMLHQKGFLNRETLDLFVTDQSPMREQEPTPPEPIGLAASVQKKKQELKEESDRLENLSMRLATQRKELAAETALIEERLKHIESARGTESGIFGAEKEDGKLAKLVKMYEGMAPEEAAPILETLPDPVVAQILLRMRNRQATRIMGSLNAGKAAGVSKLLIPEDLGAAR